MNTVRSIMSCVVFLLLFVLFATREGNALPATPNNVPHFAEHALGGYGGAHVGRTPLEVYRNVKPVGEKGYAVISIPTNVRWARNGFCIIPAMPKSVLQPPAKPEKSEKILSYRMIGKNPNELDMGYVQGPSFEFFADGAPISMFRHELNPSVQTVYDISEKDYYDVSVLNCTAPFDVKNTPKQLALHVYFHDYEDYPDLGLENGVDLLFVSAQQNVNAKPSDTDSRFAVRRKKLENLGVNAMAVVQNLIGSWGADSDVGEDNLYGEPPVELLNILPLNDLISGKCSLNVVFETPDKPAKLVCGNDVREVTYKTFKTEFDTLYKKLELKAGLEEYPELLPPLK